MRKSLLLAFSLGALLLNVTALPAGVIVSTLLLDVGTLERITAVSPQYTAWIPGDNNHWLDITPAENLPDMSAVSKVDYPNLNYKNKAVGTYAFHQAGDLATIDFTWDHSIIGMYVADNGDVVEAEAYGFAAMTFTVDVDTAYTLSGTYAKKGAAAAYQLLEFYQEPYPSPLYVASAKVSLATPDETLILGSPLGGDDVNHVEGEFEGILRAGQTYTLYSLHYIHAYDNPDPTTALGDVHLSLREISVQAVPEPGSLALFGLGGMCLVAVGGRTRRRGTSAPGQ